MAEISPETNVNNLPLIEKITNIKSMFMIFVVLLMVDLSLVQFVGKNLFTYAWQDAKIHVGKTAVIIAGWLFFYVIVAPLINAFIVWLLKWLYRRLKGLIDDLLRVNNSTTRSTQDKKYIHAASLKIWAIENSDSMALGLVQERITQYTNAQEEKRKLHMALSAFILIVAWSYFVPGTLCEAFMVSIFESTNRFIPLIVMVSGCGLASLWWQSHFVSLYEEEEVLIWYPKAMRKQQ